MRRYVHGPGDDEPVVRYEASSLSNRRFLHSDERGSIIAVSDNSGASIATIKYDEYGIPQSTAALTPAASGRFMYTGQTYIPELGLYYYKARFYSPTLGRFMQTDPIGYEDGINWYAYVDNDPINRKDPTGLCLSIKDEGVRADCLKKRTQSVENAKAYLEDKSVKKGEKEAAYKETYNEETGEVSVREGPEAGVQSGSDVKFKDGNGNPLVTEEGKDGRILKRGEDGKFKRTKEIALATGHSQPSVGNNSDPINRSLNRSNEGISNNPDDKALSKHAPAMIKTPSGKIYVFVDGKKVK